MARDATLTQDWADGTFTFRLGWKELALLQEAVDAGPFVVLQRVGDGTWKIEDISNIIRLGLIGAGMPAPDALKKVRAYVEDRPPLESLMLAQAIMSAALVGSPEENDVLGKDEAASPTA
jgi:hypothetical protein